MSKYGNIKTKKLNEEAQIPLIGLGTWQLNNGELERALGYATEAGYRHIDTADAYQNQSTIGQFLDRSKLERENVFITSKIWITDLEKEQAKQAVQKSLKELQTDYIDLLLIHWPNRDIPFAETLEAMGEMRREGLIKSIGVSNFTTNHLKDALKAAKALRDKKNLPVKISNNQIEFHPSLNQKELKLFCQENDITVTAYSPLAQGQDLNIDEIQNIANKYDKTEAQVILNWLIEQGLVVIPKSTDPKHIRQNLEALDFELEDEDIETLDNLDKNNRTVNPSFGDFDY
jgi:diketogulonate reductase-like aldo/keto reductase